MRPHCSAWRPSLSSQATSWKNGPARGLRSIRNSTPWPNVAPNAGCSPVAQQLIALSASGEGQSGRAQIGLINRAVDLAISPASDETQWGVADHWSAPFETLRSRRGDCEDYATLKYLALRAAGIHEDDVKIVILKNAFPNEDHASVAVRVDDEWLILDNRTLTLVRDTELTRAVPRFVLDQQGARRFVWASRRPRGGAVAGT